ncbi:serine hydrolase domain-containing protein [Roseateles amylovorans]|uniref:Beta-lactamase family protein n=1 Tax=Roseateles amylovorans TaxID=2978473 RepID=A0ABY6B334_9BURK|nr:serine hydrolase [Roseateles amylovorans]UXH79246.1 beta-lactamase family protein [Roseateles amylovorans]
MNLLHCSRFVTGAAWRRWLSPWLVVPLLGACAVQPAAPPTPAPPPPPELLAQDRAALEALPGGTSVLLQRKGQAMVALYARGADAQTLHDTRSAGKSVTAMLVAAAVQDGFLRRDTPVFAELTDVSPFANDGPVKRGIVVEDLLTMSSALDCNDDQSESPGNEENMYPEPRWLRWAVDMPTRTVARDTQGLGPFAYCTAGVFLLGQVLERRVPKGLEAYAQRRLFAPLGIATWQWSRSPSGETMTGGGLRLRTRDWAALAQLLLRRGAGPDGAVLAPEQVAALLAVKRATPSGWEYGELFWRRDLELRCGRTSAWMMSGNGGNHVLVLPTLDAVAVVTRTHYNQRGMHQQSTDFLTALLDRHVCGGMPTQ